jgi:UDP-N-acetylmuramyl pentapeptide phosphotransferase/UDP-N-acetylglucosamine-1-phosphate transferase
MISTTDALAMAARLALVLTLAAIVSTALILILRPWLARYALARPNARSSHVAPTPQGGGIAVIAATLLVVGGIAVLTPQFIDDPYQLVIVFIAVAGLAVVGVTDDMRPLEALPRLVLQAAAIGAVLSVLPAELRVLPVLPWWIERGLILIAGIWFVNLVNFMDGIDWMTVAEVLPITAALAAFGQAGALSSEAAVVSLALCGAMIGFAPFNRPVARLFLGDVGSLPIGLLLFWLLIQLAGNGHLAAAVLLPLYYLADTTVTLVRRLAKSEPVLQAHRSHFYQRAIDHGFSVYQIIACVFLTNLILAGLATASLNRSVILGSATVATGIVLVAALLWVFNGQRR